MINCVTVDGSADGIPDIVIATEFANEAKNSIGIVWLLRHNGDPRQPWTATEIDRLTTSHRLRTADIDGSGKRVVINVPLTGAKAEAPDYRDQAPLVFYRPGEWKRQLVSNENAGVVHGIYVIDWDGDGRDEILTASFGGIHLFKLGKSGTWTRTEIAAGNPAPWPKSGSSDVAVGHLLAQIRQALSKLKHFGIGLRRRRLGRVGGAQNRHGVLRIHPRRPGAGEQRAQTHRLRLQVGDFCRVGAVFSTGSLGHDLRLDLIHARRRLIHRAVHIRCRPLCPRHRPHYTPPVARIGAEFPGVADLALRSRPF